MHYERALNARSRAASGWWEMLISKSANRAARMPTDNLHKHGTSAVPNTLCPSFYGAVTEYLRGSWENLRGCIIIYGEAGSIYGGDLQFTGSCEFLRGVLKCV